MKALSIFYSPVTGGGGNVTRGQHHLCIRRVQTDWKMVDPRDSAPVTVRAKRGDQVVWAAEGSDLYFQFMDTDLFGDYTCVVRDGEQITLTIGQNARAGSHRFAVFCLSGKAFVVGNSPPEIIVE